LRAGERDDGLLLPLVIRPTDRMGLVPMAPCRTEGATEVQRATVARELFRDSKPEDAPAR
jgi:hypothetical protein